MLFAVAMPIHMIAPVSAGIDSVVCVRNSIQTMPASAPGNAVMMMNGSSHDWKFTTISKYTSTTARIRPNARPLNDEFIVSTWPRISIDEPLGNSPRASSMMRCTSSDTAPRSRRSVVA